MRGRELIIDSFAGGGGASLGIEWATGRSPDVAVNHDEHAIAMHTANHPLTRHYREDVFKVNPREVTRGKPVGLLWLSPDCRHFSRAKGGTPVKKEIRGLAWVAIKWAVEAAPRVIVLENVREFQEWGPLVPRWGCQGCEWKGTEGQATLCRGGKRACPRCESRKLKPARCGKTGQPLMVPCPDRKGLTFRRFVGRLKGCGYAVDWKVLNAADYGAPTHRRRLFLVARNDGRPIEWPEPTHGDPKKVGRDLFSQDQLPWRTAAECIDWTIPCPSIFERKKPLAEKTLRRIALGIKRYVLDNPRPFVVDMQRENRPRGIDEPVGTVTTQDNRFQLVTPVLANLAHGDGKDGRDRGLRVCELTDPTGTVHAGGGSFSLITPTLVRHFGGSDAAPVDAPLGTVVAGGMGKSLLVAPTLVQTGYGEREGQEPRALDLHKPLGTVMGDQKHALVTAFIAKHFGGVVGVPADTPLPTTTARGTQNQAVVANLVHLNHGDKTSSSPVDPARTVTSGGTHAALVYSFLCKYYGSGGQWQAADDPLHTATFKARFGLVTVTIVTVTEYVITEYVITDIGMRMLKPRELARAQGFPDGYKLTGNLTQQVERIGNSVCPPVAEAVVRAQGFTPSARRRKRATAGVAK